MYSLIVYGLILLLLYSNSVLALKLTQKKVLYRSMLFSFFIISILLGGRYYVGTDWSNYKEYYDDITLYGITYGDIEPLYIFLNKIISITGFSSSFFFFCISFIQLSTIFFLFKDDKRTFALGMLFYLLCCLPISLNIIRQSLAICVFLYSTRYIGKSPHKYIILIIIAGLFHYSSFILLSVYLLINNSFKLLDNRFSSITLYLISIIGGVYILNQIMNLVPALDLLGYKYSKNFNNADLEMEVSSGIGIMVNHILNILILWCLPYLKSTFKDLSNYLTIVSRAYVVGIIFANIFGLSVFLSRLPLPLVMLKIILIPYIYYYLTHSKNIYKSLLAYFFLISYILLFVASVLNGAGGISPYSFKWI